MISIYIFLEIWNFKRAGVGFKITDDSVRTKLKSINNQNSQINVYCYENGNGVLSFNSIMIYKWYTNQYIEFVTSKPTTNNHSMRKRYC